MSEFKWEDFETPSSYNEKVHDGQKPCPFAATRIQTEENDIFDYLMSEDYDQDEIFREYRIKEAKKSWIEKKIVQAEELNNEHPGIFLSSIGLILLIFALILIKLVWKFLKFIIYQISYTIANAINDASKN